MIDGLKPYPQMKDAGVAWLGEVPSDWNVTALRALAVVKKGRQPSRLFGPERPAQGVPYQSMNYMRSARQEPTEFALPEPGLVIAESGATVLLWDGANAGEFFRARGGVVSSTSALVTPCGIAPDYFFYACQVVEPHLRALTVGMGIPHVDGNVLKNLRVPVPSASEQTAIVRFLDHADRRIRRYIRAKQKLIKLLEEQKQAIIHQAVTGRIDVRTGQPYPAYKNSGVEWLGEVPEHWGIRRNGRLFAQRNETGFGDLPILEVSLRTGVRVRDFESADRKQVMADREKYKRAVAGDIAYNMMRMWQGAAGVAPVDGLISPAYVVARPIPGTEPRYFEYLFRLPAYMGEVDKYSRGIVKDRNRLYWEDFKQIPCCYPPYIEQAAIADAIARTTAGIEAASDRVRREIALFMEYRTRLIADVVTGKLDVREAAARLPDEGDEPPPDAADDESAPDEPADDLDAVPEDAEA